MNKLVVAVTSVLLPTIACATDPIAIGHITSLSYRGGYCIFKITNGSTNSCAPCPADPGGMQVGHFCWIPETQTAQAALLLSAHAQGRRIAGRVVGITSNCTMYQMTLED